MAGMQGCYPGASGTGGGTGGSTSNATLNGCYWMNGDITYRYHFDGVGALTTSVDRLSGPLTGAYSLTGST
jgi:hypothetical protein